MSRRWHLEKNATQMAAMSWWLTTGRAPRDDDVRRLAHAAIAEDGSDLSVEDCTAAEVEGGVADSGRGGLVAGDGGAVAVAQLDLVLRDSEVSQRAKRSQVEAEAEPGQKPIGYADLSRRK